MGKLLNCSIVKGKNQLSRGFTLIELLVVIAIIGILAIILLLEMNPAKRQNQARDAGTKTTISQIVTALQSYFTSHNGRYPADIYDLTASSDLRNIPVPVSGGNYYYSVAPGGCDDMSGPCTMASLYYPLYDGQMGGDVWCWRSETGFPAETTLEACTP